MKLAGTLDGVMVCGERVDGILRFSGTPVVHHSIGNLKQPVTIVIRREHPAKDSSLNE
jgi:hypothetical protein